MQHKLKFEIPIILFGFKRPNSTQRILDKIYELNASKVYIFIDAPRDINDVNDNEKVKSLFNSVDDRFIIFENEINKGCVPQIVSRLNSVFELEKQAIILEDDCIPTISFFHYCQTMLTRYHEEDSIMHINGMNIISSLKPIRNSNQDYFFSQFSFPSWGWATWSNRWKKFNQEFNTWDKYKKLLFIRFKQQHFTFWTNLFQEIKKQKYAWDIPWNLDIWKNNGLVIIPKVNLIEYIGFDTIATLSNNTNIENSAFKVNDEKINFKAVDEIKIWEWESYYEDKIVHLLKNFTKDSLI